MAYLFVSRRDTDGNQFERENGTVVRFDSKCQRELTTVSFGTLRHRFPASPSPIEETENSDFITQRQLTSPRRLSLVSGEKKDGKREKETSWTSDEDPPSTGNGGAGTRKGGKKGNDKRTETHVLQEGPDAVDAIRGRESVAVKQLVARHRVPLAARESSHENDVLRRR